MTHTTNDAPVTVEREAIERAIKATEYKYFGDYEMSDDQRESVDVLVEAARHRLAALASAPAVPIGMKPWRGGEAAPGDWDGGDVLLENGEMGDGNVWDHHPSRSPTRVVAYTPTASAPAGDGVRLDMAKRLFWADVKLGENADRIPDEWCERWWEQSSTMPLSGPGFLEKWLSLADAALARPRAAVGERGDDVGLSEAARDLLDAQKRLGPAVAFRLDLWACLEAILEGQP